jgi:hypothetical protein
MTDFIGRLDDTARELRDHGDGLATLAVRRRYAAAHALERSGPGQPRT